MTAGEGGAILTNSEELFHSCFSYQNCGRKIEGEWYEHIRFGLNERMSEFQAAILIAQLQRLDEQMSKREENARYLDTLLSQIDGVKPLAKHPGLAVMLITFIFLSTIRKLLEDWVKISLSRHFKLKEFQLVLAILCPYTRLIYFDMVFSKNLVLKVFIRENWIIPVVLALLLKRLAGKHYGYLKMYFWDRKET